MKLYTNCSNKKFLATVKQAVFDRDSTRGEVDSATDKDRLLNGCYCYYCLFSYYCCSYSVTADLSFMTTFNSKEENVFHYLTFVVFRRIAIFRSEEICEIFADALKTVRKKYPFKLIGYVIMPDHIHLILNPVGCDIEIVGKELKGISANKTIKWLKENDYVSSLEKLKLTNEGKRHHSFCVWQKKIKAVDLWSHKFILQKLNYIHLNPVRANLCDHPAKWKWSSYNAYLLKTKMEIPILPDKKGYWTDAEFESK